ncbi:AhpC/TSA family protein [Nonlabens sp. Hel1_33_55]|nr:AhpC/TSA family protein [Nonlabens sp. Hel1_33_55]
MTSCSKQEPSKTEIVGRDYLTNLINKPATDRVQVINFWATWCIPCVEELPAFVEIDDKDNIEVILISLDDVENVDELVNPFLVKNNITPTVKLLDDPYAAEWIPMVDQHWDGAIPATLIQKGSKKMFYNTSFTASELKSEINKFL